jgi:hypothetical protein
MRSERSTPLVLLGALVSVGVYAAADLLPKHTTADAVPVQPTQAATLQPQDRSDASIVIPLPVALPVHQLVPKFVIDLK